MRRVACLASVCVVTLGSVVSAQQASTGPALGPPPKADPTPGVYVPYGTPPAGQPVPYPPPPYPPPPPPGYVPLARPPIDMDELTRDPRAWVGVDALIWWTRSPSLSVPLVTTGPADRGATAGNLNAPGTVPLDGPLHFGATGGVRITAGGWFDAAHNFGLGGSLFFLGQQSAGYRVFDNSGNGSFVINTPILGAPFNTQVSGPGFDTGGVSVSDHSRFGGGDINLLVNLYRNDHWTINLLGGYRYLELDETLRIDSASRMFMTVTYTDNQGNLLVTAPPGSVIRVSDRFSTLSQFNGGQLGADVQYHAGRWTITGAAKLAIGATHELITIDGSTLVLPAGGTPVPLQGGNYATLQIGRYARNRFAVAPEAQLTLGYQVTPWLKATIGYDFLYLSQVARAGNQIDNTFDGVGRPAVPFSTSGFWAQGINLGLHFTY